MDDLSELGKIAAAGPWTIRAGHGWPVYWHIDGAHQQSIACARDEATAAFIVSVCNTARDSHTDKGSEG